MNEIKDLLSRAMKSNKEIIKGQEFSVQANLKGTDDCINLYANGAVVAVYDIDDQDLNIINYDYKKEVKFLVNV